MPPQSQSLPSPLEHVEPAFANEGAFSTTHWSAVFQAGLADSATARAALEKLCQRYWYPLYVNVRRRGWAEEDAKDLTQQFFARLLDHNYLERARPERGRFRSFLLTSLKHFLADEWEKRRTQKRGGRHGVISWEGLDPEERYRHEPTDKLSPDHIFEKRWAGELLENVLGQLQVEYQKTGREAEFVHLKSFVWGDGDSGTYAEAAGRLRMEENALKVAVHRLRKRFRDCLRQEVASTVSSPEEVEDELRHLRGLLSS